MDSAVESTKIGTIESIYSAASMKELEGYYLVLRREWKKRIAEDAWKKRQKLCAKDKVTIVGMKGKMSYLNGQVFPIMKVNTKNVRIKVGLQVVTIDYINIELIDSES